LRVAPGTLPEENSKMTGAVFAIARLQDVAKRVGAITTADERAAAAELKVPVAAVHGAATFYDDLARTRRGSRHVRICEGTACFAADGGRHIGEVERALGVSAGSCREDGSVSLQAVRCVGFCYAAPALLDGTVPYAGPRLAEKLVRGSPDAPGIPVSASSQPVVLAGITAGEDPWQHWPEVVASWPAQRLIAELRTSGLRGRGGAGFSVAAKWSAAAAGRAPRYVVGNGDEGDPGSFCDRVLMEQDSHRILAGLAYAAHAVGAERGYVYVRSEYPSAVEKLSAAVAEAAAAGHLGRNLHGGASRFEVEIVEGAGSYVAGEETALLHALEGRRGAVRPRPPYPTSSGLFGAPTVVNNIETLASVPWIVAHGGAAFARLGKAPETGTKLVCLNEAFTASGVYEVELGMPLREIIDELGGGLRDVRRLRSVQVGGPLGGFLAPNELDVPLLDSALAAYGVALGHGSLIAIDDRVAAAELLRHVWRFAAIESCGTCAPCRLGSGLGAGLAERVVAGDASALAEQRPLLATLETASMCAFGRGVPASIRTLLRVYADELPT
jgi:NADH:ubiquinone oxidoreductase subunit F (NADH-binding)/NADH:ubiquinone oxidoreductase subunit E